MRGELDRAARRCREPRAILVSVTRKASTPPPASRTPRHAVAPPSGTWRLQDAKARFSELVRRVKTDGPQRVTLHGRDCVVVIDVEDYRRLKGVETGQKLIDALQSSPHREVGLDAPRLSLPVRHVKL